MALRIIGPIKISDPVGGCRPCSSTQQAVCPLPLTLYVGCQNCFQTLRLALRYLGVLRCWQDGDGHCNPNACCPWMQVNPWPDLRAGAWLSSTVIQIYADCPSGGPQATTLSLQLGEVATSRPITTGGSPICGTTQVATVTVFDDGTFAVT